MRDILFRGISVDTGKWVYGLPFYSHGLGVFSITHSNGWTPSYNNPDEGETTLYKEVKHNTVGQSTGLKDKNGKEIYEGDIVETDGSMSFNNYDSGKGARREIYRCRAGFMGVRLGHDFDKEHRSSAHNWTNYQLWRIHGSLVIIGSIHENPELLEWK